MLPACSKCGQEGDLKSAKLCKSCNNFKAHLQRVFQKMNDVDPQIAADFNNLTPEEKREFYTKHHKLHGEGLAMKILQTTTEQRTKRFSERFVAKGKGLDEADIREKYKDKDSTIVRNILNNALSIWCPVTNRKLFIDPEYEMTTYYEEDQEYCRRIICDTSFNKKGR